MDSRLSSHDVWVEVDMAALRHNLGQVKNLVGDGVKIMAVVKANGYGHGYSEPARAFIEAGANSLAVTRLNEALSIRSAGISAPILLLAPIQYDDVEIAVQTDLDITVTSSELIDTVSKAAAKLGKTARVHIKVDTGMGRLGVMPQDAVEFARYAASCQSIQIAGIYTHFANAAERDFSAAQSQCETFFQLLGALKDAGVDTGLAHAANSATILRMPESRFDMVRPGTILYGQYPSAKIKRKLDLKPTWKLIARVCQVSELPKGVPIGYGCEYVTKRPTRTAVIPIGWADGFTLAPEGPTYRQSILRFAVRKARRRLCVKVRGSRAPVLGRVAMQMTVVDVTRIPGIQVGDEVEMPAMRIPTSSLIPRVYIDKG